MKKKQPRRKHITELTPELVESLDRKTLASLVMKLYEQNKEMSERFQAFMEEKYGRKTERHDDPNQLKLLPGTDGQSAPGDQPEPEQASSQKPAPQKKPGHARNPMPSHLDRRKIRRQPTKTELVCKCGTHRVKVNEVVRNQRYECIPAQFYVEEIIDAIWSCPNCSDSITIAPEVFEPIQNGKVGPDLLVQIAEDRWLKHLPYYRQAQAFARLGMNIPLATICGWMASLALILQPIYDAMRAELLKSKVIATDDTPVKVQDRSKKSNIKRGHEWIFMGDAEHPVNLFHYTQGRSRAGPLKFIPGYKGYLLGDCFSGNRALCAESGATFVACRAHDRRYYKKAMPNNKICKEMLDMYQDLFEIEQTARDLQLSRDDITRLRQQEAKPLLDKMKAWIDQHSISALPSSSFGKALAYSLNNWEALNNYLLDGDLRIDNNLAEQQMKIFATGRKNWYFYGSDEAGKHASILLSIFSTCLRNGITPGAYLLDVIKRLKTQPGCNPEELMPHQWKPEPRSAEITVVNDAPELVLAR